MRPQNVHGGFQSIYNRVLFLVVFSRTFFICLLSRSLDRRAQPETFRTGGMPAVVLAVSSDEPVTRPPRPPISSIQQRVTLTIRRFTSRRLRNRFRSDRRYSLPSQHPRSSDCAIACRRLRLTFQFRRFPHSDPMPMMS